jgi:long-chain acyl-CoA synthetase
MLTLTSILQRTLNSFAFQTAVVDPEGSFSWQEFARRISRAAGLLRAHDVGPGDRFAIVSRNGFRCAELMHAGYWSGAIPVPINHRLAPPEIAYITTHAECKLLVLEQDFEGIVDVVRDDGFAGDVLTIDTPGHGEAPGYDVLRDQANPEPLYDGAGEDDEALLLYTGGTTGRSKGVPLSHRNIVSNAMQIGLMSKPRANDVFLHVAPMFHSADLLANPCTLVGAAHMFLPNFTAQGVLRAIEQYGVTTTLLTPTMIIVMLQDPAFDDYDLSALRQILYGSSPMAAEWIRRALERFEGIELIQAYGLTETAPLLTMQSMEKHRQAIESGDDELLKSVGQALVGVDLKVLDADGEELPNGQPGEVVVRGPNVASSYLNRPEASAEAFRDGWFHTGDIGRLDEQGHLYLLDRTKDMIITGGENVYSLEVEAALYQHAKVQECAVVGVPDEVYGEALLAAVVPASGETLTEQELVDHCRGRIGGYKIPRRYIFLDELPKSAMNKILKNELRRLYKDQAQADSDA